MTALYSIKFHIKNSINAKKIMNQILLFLKLKCIQYFTKSTIERARDTVITI